VLAIELKVEKYIPCSLRYAATCVFVSCRNCSVSVRVTRVVTAVNDAVLNSTKFPGSRELTLKHLSVKV